MIEAVAASIIIVTYNSAECILNCIESILTNTALPYEILLLDNASQDDTVNLVKHRFPQVVIIQSSSNTGFAGGNNQAARLAQGKYLVFLNPDTRVAAGWLEPLIAVLQNNARAGAVTAQILYGQNPTVINACGNTVHFSGITYCNKLGEPKINADPFEVGAVSGAAFGMRKTVFEQLGGFPDAFFLYYEDTFLSLLLRLNGLRCYAVPASVVYHDYTPRFTDRKIFYLERNRYLTLFILNNAKIRFFMFPSLLITEFASWAFAFMAGKNEIKSKYQSWKAYLAERKDFKQRYKHFLHIHQPMFLDVYDYRMSINYIGHKSSLLIRVYSFTASWVARISLWLCKLFN